MKKILRGLQYFWSLITENAGIKIISLMISLVLWVFAVLAENPEATREIERPIQVINLNKRDYKIANPLPDVKISINASRRQIISMESDAIKAAIDLEEILDGTFDMPVQITLPPGMRLLSKSPESVTAHILRLFVKRVKPELNIEGPPFGLFVKSVDLSPGEIEIRGPRDEIDDLENARVTLRLLDAQDGIIHSDLDIKLISKNSRKFRHSTTFPTQIRAKTQLDKWKPEERAIQVITKGEPKEGFRVRDINAEPSKILITASPTVLEDIKNIETEPVNISGTEASIKKNFRLIRPTSNMFPLNPDSVTVTIKIEKIPQAPAPLTDEVKIEEMPDNPEEIK